MNANELRSLEDPVTPVPLEDVPPSLVERATAYNDAVEAFRDAVRETLGELRGGGGLDGERTAALRAAAAELVTAREWLLEIARLPSPARRAR